MAYNSAQKNAVTKQVLKDAFRIGHRQYSASSFASVAGGTPNDGVPTYFSNWIKRRPTVYNYIKDMLRKSFGRIGKVLVIVSTADQAFLEVRAPRTITIQGQTGIAGVVTTYPNYLGTGKWKNILQVERQYLTDINDPRLVSSENLAKFITRHEILHACGFEHPFDGTDGDIDLNLTVLDTDLDYPSTSAKRTQVLNGSVNPNRFAGPLDIQVMDQELRSQYD